jgi:hypothetical protein
MDGEAFFDRLYSRFYIHFPCYALAGPAGFAAEDGDDGSAAVVLLTDADMVRRYHAGREIDPPHYPITLANPRDLARFVAKLPDHVTHVTFDPEPGFHRRFPKDVIRDALPRVAGKR